MAQYIETQTLPSGALKARFSQWLEQFSEQRKLAREYRRTFNELDALRDRELADLGIARADISRIARESVYTG